MFTLEQHAATCADWVRNPQHCPNDLIRKSGYCVGVTHESWGIGSQGASALIAYRSIPKAEIHCTDPMDVPEGAVVSVRAGSRGVSVHYLSGYPVGVVFAPGDVDIVCVEPMTAPTDPFSGRFPLRLAEPGAPFEAVFEVVPERF